MLDRNLIMQCLYCDLEKFGERESGMFPASTPPLQISTRIFEADTR